MSDTNLYNLTIDELKEQARILGIQVRGNPSADTLRDKIRQAVNIEPAESKKPEAKEDVDRKKGWKKIVIAEDENDTRPVFVGINGKNFWIRRGEPVLVPPEVITVLKDAIQVVWNGKEGTSKEIPTYPYQVVS